MNQEKILKQYIYPNKKLFEEDPFRYSILAFKKWRAIQILNGEKSIVYENPLQEEELKITCLMDESFISISKSCRNIITK